VFPEIQRATTGTHAGGAALSHRVRPPPPQHLNSAAEYQLLVWCIFGCNSSATHQVFGFDIFCYVANQQPIDQ